MTRIESTLKLLNCAPSILSLFLIGCAASGCGQPANPVAQPAPKASFDWPNAGKKPATVETPSDESLTSEDYLSLGMPADDRNWSSIDMVQAQKVLAGLPGGHAMLPRYQSERSGKMFARLTSSQNLELFRNRSLPLEGRAPLALDFGDASNQIFKLYLAAFVKKKVRDSEMIEVIGAQLRMAVVNVELISEFLPTLDKDEPKYEIRMRGVDKMKGGLAGIVMGALQTFAEQDSYRQSELTRLADYVRDTFPTLVPFLPPGARTEAKATLKKMLEDPKMEPFHAALQDVSEKLENAAADNAARSSAEWKRYRTADGGCSAEFPQPPKEDSLLTFGFESKRILVYLEEPDILYMLTFTAISSDVPAASDEERLDAIRENLPLVASQRGKKFQFVSEVQDGIPAANQEF